MSKKNDEDETENEKLENLISKELMIMLIMYRCTVQIIYYISLEYLLFLKKKIERNRMGVLPIFLFFMITTGLSI